MAGRFNAKGDFIPGWLAALAENYDERTLVRTLAGAAVPPPGQQAPDPQALEEAVKTAEAMLDARFQAVTNAPDRQKAAEETTKLKGLSEAIHFAEKAGLDLDLVMATISKGAAQSWQMENRWKSMHEGRFDFGFAVDWMRKDLAICMTEASRNGASLPVTELVDQFYADVQKMGGARWDTSSLIARLKGRGTS